MTEGKRHLAALLNGGFIQAQSAPATAASQRATASPTLPDEDISLAKSYVVHSLHELAWRLPTRVPCLRRSRKR
ncbi:MAG: hypothetical protein H6942_04155 [Candidatus Accumulibacter sp.]|uniref:hypothetical protein n=1 Tax=Accumulibacter sp. TaxID=2053492 RepID=UPI0025FE8541|nr:hypothetical protein [Accumulibacter sp.]MCP5247727.1 hypothetical protein [Accumulibacter sp.]